MPCRQGQADPLRQPFDHRAAEPGFQRAGLLGQTGCETCSRRAAFVNDARSATVTQYKS
jgi:hypothetical protein